MRRWLSHPYSLPHLPQPPTNCPLPVPVPRICFCALKFDVCFLVLGVGSWLSFHLFATMQSSPMVDQCILVNLCTPAHTHARTHAGQGQAHAEYTHAETHAQPASALNGQAQLCRTSQVPRKAVGRKQGRLIEEQHEAKKKFVGRDGGREGRCFTGITMN